MKMLGIDPASIKVVHGDTALTPIAPAPMTPAAW